MSENTFMINVIVDVEDAFLVFRMFSCDFCFCSGCAFSDMRWFNKHFEKGQFNMNIRVTDSEIYHPVNHVASVVIEAVREAYEGRVKKEHSDILLDVGNIKGLRIIKQKAPWTNCQKKMQQRCFSYLTRETATQLENITGLHITQDHPDTIEITEHECA